MMKVFDKVEELIKYLLEEGFVADGYDQEVMVYYYNEHHHSCIATIEVLEDCYSVSSENVSLDKATKPYEKKTLKAVKTYLDHKAIYNRRIK